MGKNNGEYNSPKVTTNEQVKTEVVDQLENTEDITVNTEALTQGPVDEVQEPVESNDINPEDKVEDTDAQGEDKVPEEIKLDDESEDIKEPEQPIEEIQEEVVPTKNYTFSLTEAIAFSKDNSTTDLLDKLLAEGHLDIKMFAAELVGVINAYNKKTEVESNNGNRKLYNLLLRTLKVENAPEFKFKFDVLNRTFLEDVNFNPVTLLNCTLWTKSEKDLATFAQLATIIEDLADRETRNSNKKRIANLNNLGLDAKSIENIKNYYKL